MSEAVSRYIFSGHAIGAAAQFDRLDAVQNLDHTIPTLGASVLPVTGGLSQSHVSNYCFTVDQPRKRSLLSVRRIDTTVSGKKVGDVFATETQVEVEAISVVEKLHIDFVKLHFLSTRDPTQADAVVTTSGNQIQGIRLGKVEAKITFDEDPLLASGSREQLADFYRKQSDSYRRDNCWRFGTDPGAVEIKEQNGHYKWSLVRQIELLGTDPDITVHGNMICWRGFGKIYLGEVIVKHNDRRVTMVRLQMGSDAGGPGTVGDGQSNGAVGSN
jgi:hypothetical protein